VTVFRYSDSGLRWIKAHHFSSFAAGYSAPTGTRAPSAAEGEAAGVVGASFRRSRESGLAEKTWNGPTKTCSEEECGSGLFGRGRGRGLFRFEEAFQIQANENLFRVDELYPLKEVLVGELLQDRILLPQQF
jgi:hypothetical protein